MRLERRSTACSMCTGRVCVCVNLRDKTNHAAGRQELICPSCRDGCLVAQNDTLNAAVSTAAEVMMISEESVLRV